MSSSLGSATSQIACRPVTNTALEEGLLVAADLLSRRSSSTDRRFHAKAPCAFSDDLTVASPGSPPDRSYRVDALRRRRTCTDSRRRSASCPCRRRPRRCSSPSGPASRWSRSTTSRTTPRRPPAPSSPGCSPTSRPIAGYSPDLVVASAATAVPQLKKLGITTLVQPRGDEARRHVSRDQPSSARRPVTRSRRPPSSPR